MYFFIDSNGNIYNEIEVIVYIPPYSTTVVELIKTGTTQYLKGSPHVPPLGRARTHSKFNSRVSLGTRAPWT